MNFKEYLEILFKSKKYQKITKQYFKNILLKKEYFKQYSKQYMNVLLDFFCVTATEGLANI